MAKIKSGKEKKTEDQYEGIADVDNDEEEIVEVDADNIPTRTERNVGEYYISNQTPQDERELRILEEHFQYLTSLEYYYENYRQSTTLSTFLIDECKEDELAVL